MSPETLSLDDPRALITQAVREVTGLATAGPREGQGALHDAIRETMERRGHFAAQAPTGSGKSLAALAPAFMAAIERGERTIISTESIALMGQLQDKDVPTVQAAARRLYPDVDIQVAFLKGVANYLDPEKVIAAAQKALSSTSVDPARLRKELDGRGAISTVQLDIDDDKESTFRALLDWALGVYERDDEKEHGDRHSCPVEHSPDLWRLLSASSVEASDGKRIGVTPKIEAARVRASESEIMVTNHSMLAVQAAKSLAVVVGNQKLGVFDHIIIDEAHTLPNDVRSQGAELLSGGAIERVARQVYRASGNSSALRDWRDAATFLADSLDQDLERYASGAQGGVRRLTDGEDALGEHVETIKIWAKQGSEALGRSRDSDPAKKAQAAIAKEALSGLAATAASLSRHRSGWARWIEKSQPRNPSHRAWWEANVSPIDVGFLLRDNLWGGAPKDPSMTDEERDELEQRPLSVSVISATMPSNYPMQAGLKAQLVQYPSPFDVAYGASALYVPQVNESTREDFAALSTDRWGKVKFDTFRHASWAQRQIIDLVRASGGRALVIAAKAADGKMYADALRKALPDLTIHDQWSGGSGVVAEWREDIDSVLVGTKSMATGIDPAGDTCQLVIVDRVPRSPGNPLDDARVEAIAERTGDKWRATDHVYAVDASLLLKQSAGRLLRSASDVGMCAVLDPRLLKLDAKRRGPFTYQENTRQIYMESLYAFGTRIQRLDDATAWLREHCV